MALLDWLHETSANLPSPATAATSATVLSLNSGRVADVAAVAGGGTNDPTHRIRLLSDPEFSAPAIEDVYVNFAERAAIMEHHGHIDRPEAEAAALSETLRIFDRYGVCEMVACGGCVHFTPNPAHYAKLGQCSIKGEGVGGRLPLYPEVRRFCRDFRGG